MLSDADLRELGIPMGPRRLLLNEFHAIKQEQDRVRAAIKSDLDNLRQRQSGQEEEASISYGLAGTSQMYVKYPQLNFRVSNFFAMGSPIAMFLTVRGIEKLDTDFKLPTCDQFFNIFHPVS